MTSLDDLMNETLGDGGLRVLGGRDLYGEVMENATGTIWMALEPITREEHASLDVGDLYSPTGVGLASMDAAIFSHSPNHAADPVRERTIGGRRFINVAEADGPDAITPPSETDGPTTIRVNKAHVLGFAAGRQLAILRTQEGDFVECIGSSDLDDTLKLPAGATLEQVTLSQPLVVRLPTPTKTYWWMSESNNGPRSFQGPVNLPSAF